MMRETVEVIQADTPADLDCRAAGEFYADFVSVQDEEGCGDGCAYPLSGACMCFNTTLAAYCATRPPATDVDALASDLIARLRETWTDFLDANPDDITSPEEWPDHALMTGAQFEEWAASALQDRLTTLEAEIATLRDELARGRDDERDRVVAWLVADNEVCNCSARCDEECGCGAWGGYKSVYVLSVAEALAANAHRVQP